MKRTPLKQYSSLKSFTGLSSRKGFKPSTISLKRTSHRMKSRTNDDLGIADSKFSKIIIARDGKCLKCGTTIMLSCSHFYGRANYATRFDPDNCIALCIEPCHNLWESKKKTDYKEFMIALLGFNGFCKLEERSKLRVTQRASILKVQKFIKENLIEQEIQY